MASLYGRLQRYQNRPGREPLEDFLTEAIADLLNRMPKDAASELAATWFLPSDAARAQWRTRVATAQRLSWSTQVWIDGPSYRIDIVAWADDDHPLLVVETKVWAGHQKHRAPGDDPALTQGQLNTYGQWLARALAGDAWPGALALLSFGSEAPADFLDRDNQTFGIRWRTVARGSDVYKGLKRVADAAARPHDSAGTALGERPAWIVLAQEFCAFLKEKNMSEQTMTSADYGLTETFLPTYQRLENTFTRIWRKTAAFKNDHARPRSFRGMQLQGNGALVWGWFYLTDEFAIGKKSFVAVGLRFPMAGNTFFAGAEPELPESSCAFVSWNNELNVEKPELPSKAWSRTGDGDLIVCRELSAFPVLDGDARADAIGGWALQCMTEPVLAASKASGQAWPSRRKRLAAKPVVDPAV